jgi:hypothetical protein
MLRAGRLWVQFLTSIGFFNRPNPSSHACGPGVDLTSNRNEYQEFGRGGMA